MNPITREEYYLAKIAGTWQGKTPEPVTIEEYYLATMAGDYSGNTPQPVTRLQYYMAKAAGVWGGSIPAPVTRLEYYWAAIAGKEGHIPDPVTRQEYLLYAISQSNNDVINTVSGSTIIIADAAEGRPFRGLRVFGRTEQVRTTGAQLFDAKTCLKSQIEKGVVSINSDGKIVLNGVIDANNRAFTVTLQPGTYTLSADKPSTWHIIAPTDGVFNQKITVDVETTYNCYIANGTYNNIETTPMINVGSSALPYEPYTGGKPSPSPEYPQEIVSAGESGTINVSISDSGSQSQSLTLATPNGLPGVPVSKDGNYTDSNGQQWICDEIDLGRGKYVQRIGHNANVNDWVRKPGNPDIESTTSRFALNIENIDNYMYSPCICNRLSYAKVDSYGTEGTYTTINETGVKRIFARIEGITSLEDFRAAMPDLEVIWLLETPIERDLTPEEIAAYKALRTYGPTTVITNDAGAGMEVTYVVER